MPPTYGKSVLSTNLHSKIASNWVPQVFLPPTKGEFGGLAFIDFVCQDFFIDLSVLLYEMLYYVILPANIKNICVCKCFMYMHKVATI